MGKKRADGANKMARSNRLSEKAKSRPSRRLRVGAIILAGIGLVLLVIFMFLPSQRQRQAEPIPREALTAGAPINKVDPTSGIPIVLGITSSYKGYTIGHCCAKSKGHWEALSESQKDVKIQSFLQ